MTNHQSNKENHTVYWKTFCLVLNSGLALLSSLLTKPWAPMSFFIMFSSSKNPVEAQFSQNCVLHPHSQYLIILFPYPSSLLRWYLITSDSPLARILLGDFPGGPVVKTLCSNARGTSSIPGQGTRSCMLQLRAHTKAWYSPIKKKKNPIRVVCLKSAPCVSSCPLLVTFNLQIPHPVLFGYKSLLCFAVFRAEPSLSPLLQSYCRGSYTYHTALSEVCLTT